MRYLSPVTYLTRHVAAHDATEKGQANLGDYNDEKGESPGRWLGTGLAGLGMEAGEAVSAEQMRSLFRKGRHRNAPVHEASVAERDGSPCASRKAAFQRSLPLRPQVSQR